MKRFFALILMLSTLTSFAQAACNPEAMFIGTVKNVQQFADHYTYQIRLGFEGNYFFQPSGACPMWEPELEKAVIKEEGVAAFANGQMISGVLVLDEATGEFHLE